MNFLKSIGRIMIQTLFGNVIRHIKYKKKLKELRKRDPFIYK